MASALGIRQRKHAALLQQEGYTLDEIALLLDVPYPVVEQAMVRRSINRGGERCSVCGSGWFNKAGSFRTCGSCGREL